LVAWIHSIFVDTADTALEGHIEQVAVDDGVPVGGLQEPCLDGLENVLAKARVPDVEVLQRYDVQLVPRLGLGRELGLVEGHITAPLATVVTTSPPHSRPR